MNPKKSENFIIFILSALFFFHIVEFMIMMPLGPNLMRVLDINASQFGHLVSIYNFAAAMSGIAGLLWMDRWDRKKVLIIVNVSFAIGTACCFFANSYITLLIARMITGAFGGVIGALCMTIVGDLVPFERRGFAMSKLMSAFSIASIAGIPLGLYIVQHLTWQSPFLFITGGSLIFCMIAVFTLPSITEHLENQSPTTLTEISDILFDMRHVKCFLFMMLLMLSQFMIIPYISTLLVNNSGLLESQLPLVYFAGGLATAISNPLIGKLSDMYNKPLLFRICAVLVWVPIILITHYTLSTLFLCIFVTTLFFIFSSGRMSPAIAIISAAIDIKKRGRFMSVNSAVQQSSAGLATWIGGLLITTNSQGELLGLEHIAYFSIIMSFLSVLWVSQIKVHSSQEVVKI